MGIAILIFNHDSLVEDGSNPARLPAAVSFKQALIGDPHILLKSIVSKSRYGFINAIKY